MGLEVVGYGLGEDGWREFFRMPLRPGTQLKGLTETVCNAVHDLGARGATVQIIESGNEDGAEVIDGGECPCDLCAGQG